MQKQAMKQKKKKWMDTLIIALVFAMPLAAAFWGAPIWNDLGLGTARFSAAMAMPEAGLDALLNLVSPPQETEPDNNADNPGDSSGTTAPQPEPLPDPTDIEAAMLLIPESRRGKIQTTRLASHGNGSLYFDIGNGCVWNQTNYSTADMQTAASQPLPFGIELNSSQPQVLIYHTHSTESYDRFDAGFYDSEYPSRSTVITENMNAVGQAMTDTLNSLGVNTIHATEYHDYPSYNGAYQRSWETAQYYLDLYPSIKIVLDVHRDAIEYADGTRAKPTTTINGQKAAQIMIICSAGASSNPVSEFRKTLSFAAHLQDSIETLYPTLARPVRLAHVNYNAELSVGSLLIEVGTHANTLDEATYSGELVARALAKLFKS